MLQYTVDVLTLNSAEVIYASRCYVLKVLGKLDVDFQESHLAGLEGLSGNENWS